MGAFGARYVTEINYSDELQVPVGRDYSSHERSFGAEMAHLETKIVLSRRTHPCYTGWVEHRT